MDVLIDCISLAEADVEAEGGGSVWDDPGATGWYFAYNNGERDEKRKLGGEGGVVQPKGREEKIPDELAPAWYRRIRSFHVGAGQFEWLIRTRPPSISADSTCFQEENCHWQKQEKGLA